MDNISEYEEPDGSERTYGNLKLAENEAPQRQTSRQCPGRLPRVSVHLLQLLTSLGLFLLLATLLFQVSRIHRVLQNQTAERAKKLTQEEELDTSGSGSGLEEWRPCRSCPWTWTEFQGSCYLVFRPKRSWSDALSACQDVNALLVVINSEAEQKFLQSWKVRRKKATWIGLSNSYGEGNWRWVDDTPLESSFWKEGIPNNFDKDCAVLQDDGWKERQCTRRRMWICEKPSFPCLKR